MRSRYDYDSQTDKKRVDRQSTFEDAYLRAYCSRFEAVESDCRPSDATSEHFSRAWAAQEMLTGVRDCRGTTTGERFLDLGIVPLSVICLQLYDYEIFFILSCTSVRITIN